ncbi:hypothetical protein PS415_09050, partial [Pediococcus pentosaceus]
EEAQSSANQAQVDATQAKADATKAQADATTAQNSAQQALDNITVVDSKVTKLSDSTTAQFNTLNNGYQEVISTVNNMDIGGRNIVLDSSNMGSFRIWQADGNSKLSDDKKEITVTTSHGGINIEKKNLSGYLPNKGDTIVISADVKGNSHLEFNFNDGNSFVGTGISIVPTIEYKRYSTTFEWNPVNIDTAFFIVYAAGTAGQYLTIKNVKIEIGNKPTDWSPAPEDLASQTQITALNNLINQKVSNDQYQSDKTQTANLISQTVTNAVNNINVGGRNYILNSDFYITSGQKNVLSSVEPNEYSGKNITVSVDIEINNLKTIADSGPTRVGYEASFHASDNSNVYVGAWKNLTKSDIGKSFKYRAINNTYDLTNKTITSINEGNGSLGGVYIQGVTADSIKVGHPKLEIATKATDWSPAPEDLASETDITASINNIHLGVKNADGSTAMFNMNSNTILMDTAQTIISGKTNILDGTI